MASLFEQKKAEITEAAMQNLNKNGEPKRSFSKSQFNELTAAYLNSPEYVETTMKTKDGSPVLVESTPVKDFRENIIGGITKAAGLDKDDQQKMIDEYTFSPKADYHSFMSNVIEAYAGECHHKFAFNPRADLTGSVLIETVPEVTKTVKVPGTDTEKTVHYGQYRKIKAKSTCPGNLREDV